jgi:hypothetical protein
MTILSFAFTVTVTTAIPIVVETVNWHDIVNTAGEFLIKASTAFATLATGIAVWKKSARSVRRRKVVTKRKQTNTEK